MPAPSCFRVAAEGPLDPSSDRPNEDSEASIAISPRVSIMTRHATQPPIRFSLRTYSPAEIEALNSDLGLRGKAAFRPAEELLADIAAGKAPTRAAAPGWYYHPDERVQLALLEREDLTPFPRFDTKKHFRLLGIWAKAYAQAIHEGVVWTPVLDRIAGRRQYWPLRTPGQRVLGSPDFLDRLPPTHRIDLPYRNLAEHADLLQDWISGGDPERVALLLRAETDDFVACGLAQIRRLSRTLLFEILRQRPTMAPILARRRTLSARIRDALKEWAFEDLLRTKERWASLKNEEESYQTKWDLAYGARVLQELAWSRQSHGVPSFTMVDAERVLALLGTDQDVPISSRTVATEILLASTPFLDETALLKLIPHLKREPSLLRRLVVTANRATPRVWKACLEHSSTEAVFEGLSLIPAAVRDPEIRARICRSDRVDVLLRLVDSATEQEFPRLYRKLLRRSPEAAAQALSRRAECARLLTRDDLMPLLRSDDRQTRVLAITLMSDGAGREASVSRRKRTRPSACGG